MSDRSSDRMSDRSSDRMSDPPSYTTSDRPTRPEREQAGRDLEGGRDLERERDLERGREVVRVALGVSSISHLSSFLLSDLTNSIGHQALWKALLFQDLWARRARDRLDHVGDSGHRLPDGRRCRPHALRPVPPKDPDFEGLGYRGLTEELVRTAVFL